MIANADAAFTPAVKNRRVGLADQVRAGARLDCHVLADPDGAAPRRTDDDVTIHTEVTAVGTAEHPQYDLRPDRPPQR